MTVTQDLSLDISESIEIESEIDDAFAALVHRLGEGNSSADNQPMPMVLEQRPGGRWFRDLGNEQGHLWGFVQVIKPPSLIEIQGPMFMSYAVAGHLQLRLTPVAGGTELSLRHRVLGAVEEDHLTGLTAGWGAFLTGVKHIAESS